MAAIVLPLSSKKPPRSSSTINGHAPPSAALEAVGARPRRIQRRDIKQASYELCNHAKAYLEAGQYASGYDFLHSLLAVGTSISTPAQPYSGFSAPPAYIALAASLVVYPNITAKTRSREIRKGSNAALRYLQCIHTTVDEPAYPTIRKAFNFPEEIARRRAPARGSTAASQSPEPGGDIECIAGDAANSESLWTLAEDFWHIVGWAFNCSRSHKKRWARWKPWLSTMLNFLETDWDLCMKRSEGQDNNSRARLSESLLWHYIIGDANPVNRGTRRRIVKAILATASVESLRDYPEIWEKETEGPQRERQEEKQLGKVDFETGDLADYDNDEEMQDALSEDSDDEASSAFSDDSSIGNLHDATRLLGGIDAVELRQRLIALPAQVALHMPTDFTTLSDFFDNILEDLIQLPTITLKVLLSTSKLLPRHQLAFCANLLLPLVSGTLPDYFLYEPTQQHFEQTFLVLRGTNRSFACNAKISLILEQMLIYMVTQDQLSPTKPLRVALETGIKTRHSIYGTGKAKRGSADEESQAKALMEACSDRMLAILELLEMVDGEPPQIPERKTQNGAVFLSFGSGSSLSPAPEILTDEDD